MSAPASAAALKRASLAGSLVAGSCVAALVVFGPWWAAAIGLLAIVAMWFATVTFALHRIATPDGWDALVEYRRARAAFIAECSAASARPARPTRETP